MFDDRQIFILNNFSFLQSSKVVMNCFDFLTKYKEPTKQNEEPTKSVCRSAPFSLFTTDQKEY